MRVLVIHQGKRDGYELAAGLAEGGHDVTLVTSGYGTTLIKNIAKK